MNFELYDWFSVESEKWNLSGNLKLWNCFSVESEKKRFWVKYLSVRLDMCDLTDLKAGDLFVRWYMCDYKGTRNS